MTLSDKINLTLAIGSFLLAALSIITILVTIRQNSKMIEASTRPNVVIYGTYTDVQNPNYYLIIKNFGSSSALITDFQYSDNLKDYTLADGFIPLSDVKGFCLAPNQSIMSNIDPLKIEPNMNSFEFDITYKSSTHRYTDHFSINPGTDVPNIRLRASTENKELKIISYCLQELIERML